MSQSPRIGLYFDPASQHFLRDRLFDVNYAGHAGDQILAPYVYLKEFLNARGIPVRTADYLPPKPDGFRNIYVSSGRLCSYRRLAKRPDITLSAFFAMECPTVEPEMYRELNRAQGFFKRIFSWSDGPALEPFVGRSLRCLPMCWPQSFESVHEEVWYRTERGFLVMLNGNKLPRFHSPCRELYSERRRAIAYFSRTGEIDLYGVGWDGPTFMVGTAYLPGTFGRVRVPGTVQRFNRHLLALWQRYFPDPYLVAARRVYRGFATSKAEVLAKYKFALCFENSVLKGWITEKIFDCFFAGTVPVYWGAPNIEDHVPRECFIDMRRFKDYDDLKAYLKSLTDKDIAAYRDAAREFLKSAQFQPFTKHAFAELFARMIEEDAEVKLSAVEQSKAQTNGACRRVTSEQPATSLRGPEGR